MEIIIHTHTYTHTHLVRLGLQLVELVPEFSGNVGLHGHHASVILSHRRPPQRLRVRVVLERVQTCREHEDTHARIIANETVSFSCRMGRRREGCSVPVNGEKAVARLSCCCSEGVRRCSSCSCTERRPRTWSGCRYETQTR